MISNEFHSSEVHGAMNHRGSLAKLTCSGFIHFARGPVLLIAP